MITRTVSELAQVCGATLEGDGERPIVGPASLAEATELQVSFLGNERYAADLERTRAGAVLVQHGLECSRSDLTLLRCEDPSGAFTRVIELFQRIGGAKGLPPPRRAVQRVCLPLVAGSGHGART